MAEKDAEFDPYHKWLGIPRERRPVTYYQLLGIAPTEKDAEVIEDAAMRQSSHVRTYQLGPHAEACQRILNEIAQARVALLNPDKRKAYDAKLPKPTSRPRPVPAETRPAILTSPRRMPPPKAKVPLAAIIVGGVAVAAVLAGGGVWLSQSGSPREDASKKERPKAVASAEKKPEPSRSIEPAHVQPKVPAPVVAPEPKVEPKKEPQAPSMKASALAADLRTWRSGDNRISLLRKSDGIALNGGAMGSFNGFGESIRIHFGGEKPGPDYLFEGTAALQLEGYANCVTGLPEGWFELDKVRGAIWDQKRGGPVDLLAENDGVCWLSGFSGKFGEDEGIRVYRADGKWKIVGAGSGVAGRAIVLPFGKNVDRTKLRISEIAWQPEDGPLSLLDLKDGFCALTEIHGDFQSPTQQVKLSVKDGVWRIEGNDTQGSLGARVLRVSLTGNLPKTPEDAETPPSEVEKIPVVKAPQPTARWTFDIDARDAIGNMHGVVTGHPTFSEGRMHMVPKDRMAATLPFDVSERTLEIWSYVKMAIPKGRHFIVIRDTDESGLHDLKNGNWDGIMFGGAARRIYPGSDSNHRSKKFNIPTETSGPSDLLHLAAVYARDNTITFYRNGKVLARPFRPEGHDVITYRKGRSAIVVGGDLDFEVEEARFYNRALSAEEIAASYRTFK